MKRAYIGVLGSGLGHASRMTAVGKRLIYDGCEVRFSSSGDATTYLRQVGFACDDIPLVDVVFTENGNFSATDTMRVAPWLMLRMMQQTGIEARNMIRFDPEVVLSDSAPASVIASKLIRRKSVTVLNQLKLVSSPKTPPIAAGSINFLRELTFVREITFVDGHPFARTTHTSVQARSVGRADLTIIESAGSRDLESTIAATATPVAGSVTLGPASF